MKRLAIFFCLAVLAGCAVQNDPSHLLQRKVAGAVGNTLMTPQPGQDGLVTVADGNEFVQCRQSSLLPNWRCEAAGTTMQPSLASVLTPARVTQLAALGFKPDPAFGNYVLEVAPTTDPDQLAAAIVQALSQGYGADIAAAEVDARRLTTQACPPRRNFGQDQAGAINTDPAMAGVSTAACSAMDALTAEPTDAAGADARPTRMPTPNKVPKDVVTAYGPTVAKEMARLRRARTARIWITLDGADGHIQCRPDPADRAFACEATAAAGKSAPQHVGLLHMAGFSDAEGAPNHTRRFPYRQFSDVQMARLLMTLLRDVYGFDGSSFLHAHDELGDVALMPANMRLK
ncbi:MAG TPA: hypothetical protein VL574_16540 [Stellaceae bacterium]|nr:hypothetical protein [Stellaceae bacterium]